MKTRFLKSLQKMPAEDEMAREGANRELRLAAEKKTTKGEVFNQKRTVKKKRFTLKKAVILK